MNPENVNQALQHISNHNPFNHIGSSTPQFNLHDLQTHTQNLINNQSQDDDDNEGNVEGKLSSNSVEPVNQSIIQRLKHHGKQARGEVNTESVPKNVDTQARLVDAAYINHDKGFVAAQKFLDDNGLNGYKINEDVANNAPSKRVLLFTSPDGESLVAIRGTADKTDIKIDAEIVGKSAVGAQIRENTKDLKEIDAAFELIKQQGVSKTPLIVSHSLGGHHGAYAAEKYASENNPITHVGFNGAWDAGHVFKKGGKNRNPHSTQVAWQTDTDPVSLLAAQGKRTGAVDELNTISAVNPKKDAGVFGSVAHAHATTQFTEGDKETRSATTKSVGDNHLKAKAQRMLRGGATGGVGLGATAGVHALMESLGADGGSIEAVDTITSGAVGAAFGGTSKKHTRASGLVQSATSGFVGNRITDATHQFFGDSWDGRLGRAAADNIVSEITGEVTARGVIEGMTRTGASQIAKKLAERAMARVGVRAFTTAMRVAGAATAPESFGVSLLFTTVLSLGIEGGFMIADAVENENMFQEFKKDYDELDFEVDEGYLRDMFESVKHGLTESDKDYEELTSPMELHALHRFNDPNASDAVRAYISKRYIEKVPHEEIDHNITMRFLQEVSPELANKLNQTNLDRIQEDAAAAEVSKKVESIGDLNDNENLVRMIKLYENQGIHNAPLIELARNRGIDLDMYQPSNNDQHFNERGEPVQEPTEQPSQEQPSQEQPIQEPQAAQIQQNDDGTLAAADTMGA
tara:strand:- start:3978 stop:6221 length:2244 start_codon:yes stop_codon:yes gene_type:complete